MSEASSESLPIDDRQHLLPTIVLEPRRSLFSFGLREIWEYRELLAFLTWRDVKVRYQQTLLGAAWAIIQPVFMMLVFTLFFGRLAHVPSDGLPYPVFAFSALLPWQLFAFALAESSNSVVSNERLITKVYFPRLVVPMSAVMAGLVDFSIAFVVLVGMLFYYGITPGIAVLALPVFVLLALATALSVGIWLSALNVQFRDVRYTLTFLTQFWLFATPVSYPLSLVPEKWRPLYSLNPMVGVIEGFRWALLGKSAPPVISLVISCVVVALLLVGGVAYFRRMEQSFADLV